MDRVNPSNASTETHSDSICAMLRRKLGVTIGSLSWQQKLISASRRSDLSAHDISVIVVTNNSADDIIRCLVSLTLSASRSGDIEINSPSQAA